MLLDKFEFIKKNVIYKKNFSCNKKSGTVTKVNLVTTIKKYNQLYF